MEKHVCYMVIYLYIFIFIKINPNKIRTYRVVQEGIQAHITSLISKHELKKSTLVRTNILRNNIIILIYYN